MAKLKNRKHSIIDSLEPDIKETVDEMIRANFTYREIVSYIKDTGTDISIGSVHRYVKHFRESLERLRVSQENFRALSEEIARYPDMDMAEGMLRILSAQVLDAVSQMPEENIKYKDFDSLVKSAVSLAKAVAYKKNIDIKSKDILSNGADVFRTMIFDAMAEENPTLYNQVCEFLKAKEGEINVCDTN